MKKSTVSRQKGRKILVRNSSVPVRPLVVKEVVGSRPGSKQNSTSEENGTEETDDTKDFRSPDFCTVLQLAEEIRKIREKDVGFNKVESSKYRNLNFLPEEKIYQDLIDLDLNDNAVAPKIKSQASSHSMSKKDPEPDFSKILKHTLQKEYSFSSSVVPEIKKRDTQFDGHSIYEKLKSWKS